MTWEEAYDSLMSCIIGTISTMDLIHIKGTIEQYPNPLLEDYYKRAIEDHCKMSLYKNLYIQ